MTKPKMSVTVTFDDDGNATTAIKDFRAIPMGRFHKALNQALRAYRHEIVKQRRQIHLTAEATTDGGRREEAGGS